MSYGADEWEILYRSGSEAECRERALVLQSVGVVHEIRLEPEGFAIAAPSAHAGRGRSELEAYAAENREWRVDRPASRRYGDGWNGVLGFVAVLAVMAVFQKRQAFGVDWFSLGKTHAGLIRSGEWWRTITALSLHVDLEHVLSNLFIGGLVGLFAGQSVGAGLAWCGIVVGGALGNLVNAWIRSAEHTSVGSSTAIFAALGLLAAHAWWQRRTRRTSALERWAPLVGGVLLLGILGTGGGRTDVPAHVFGFLCGVPLGAVCGRLGEGVTSSVRAQVALGTVAVSVLVVGWMFALPWSSLR